MEIQFVTKSYHGQRIFVARGSDLALPVRLIFAKAFAHHVVSNNIYSHAFEIFIPSGVIAMQMSIDKKSDFSRIECFDGAIYFIGERSELIIDHKSSVFAYHNANISAGTF